MKTTTITAAVGSAVLILTVRPCQATSQHQHLHLHRHQLDHEHLHHQHHAHKRDVLGPSNATANPRYESRRPERLHARGGAKCEFPANKGLFAVTPSDLNGGWALAPDQECVDGTWCPIACPPGKVMAQWKPNTHYTYPDSTRGGIYCNNGEIEVPFEDKPWCVDGTGAVEAVNKAGSVVSFCQTVLPGYEDMIIPTDVFDTATLAVPDPSYWDSTAAHFYINAPGVSSNEGCHWGDESQPIGNWAPYVAGANTDGTGNTFVKLGINPVWQDSDLYNTKPTFGLEIECDGHCDGLPCKIDGSGVVSNQKADGAGGSAFCVATVAKGSKASIVVSNLDGSGDDGGDDGDDGDEASTSSSAEPTSTSSVSTSTPEPTPTSSSIPTTSSAPPSTSAYPTSSPSEAPTTTSDSTSTSFTSAYPVYSSSTSTPFFLGGVFHQNETSSSSDSSSSGGKTTSAVDASTTTTTTTTSSSNSGSASDSPSESGSESIPTPTESKGPENAGPRQDGAAVAGLVVAFVAAIYLL